MATLEDYREKEENLHRLRHSLLHHLQIANLFVFADYASRGFWFERICSNLSESTALKCGRSKFGTES
jgi:hypothetical protein